jgi:hypothetical protein
MTVSQQNAPAGNFLDRLTTTELNVLIAKLRAGWYAAAAVYPAVVDPFWRDSAELLHDLHGVWMRAFDREGEGST